MPHVMFQASVGDGGGAAVVAFPNTPFKPGAGRPPAVESVLSGVLQTLESGEPDLELGFLYGSRGNGKTVLLNWLEREAEMTRAPDGKAIA